MDLEPVSRTVEFIQPCATVEKLVDCEIKGELGKRRPESEMGLF